MTEHLTHKRYLGDGVYASFDGYYIWLTTERENRTHSIALEPEVFTALVNYLKSLLLDVTKE